MFASNGVNMYEIVLLSHHKYLLGSFELMLNFLTCILINPHFKIIFMFHSFILQKYAYVIMPLK